MSKYSLTEQALNLLEDKVGAIMLQHRKPGSNNGPRPYEAMAIIRRIRTPDTANNNGWKYALHSLMGGRTGSGMYGTLDGIINYAEKYYGPGSDVSEWIGCNYEDLPTNLYPM